MRHHDPHLLRLPAQLFGVKTADVLAVDVAVHAAQGPKVSQPPREVRSAEISAMPNLVAGLEMAEDRLIEEMVRVG